MTVIGALLTDVTLLFQFMMRYMAISGIVWNFIYIIFGACVSYYAKWFFFFFIDANDYDMLKTKHYKYGWFLFKSFMAIICIIIIFFTTIIGLILINKDSNNGLFFFISIVLLIYYGFNTLVSCKPFALISLWRDEIPQPSLEFFEEQEKIERSFAKHLRNDDLTK